MIIGLEEKIETLREKIAEKISERGTAMRDDINGWHDNSAFDLANEELMVLRAHLKELEDLRKKVRSR